MESLTNTDYTFFSSAITEDSGIEHVYLKQQLKPTLGRTVLPSKKVDYCHRSRDSCWILIVDISETLPGYTKWSIIIKYGQSQPAIFVKLMSCFGFYFWLTFCKIGEKFWILSGVVLPAVVERHKYELAYYLRRVLSRNGAIKKDF